MIRKFLVVWLALLVGISFAGKKPDMKKYQDLLKKIDIPYQKFVLKNGLTLIVHEDHKAPIVAVNVWYHVGSKNEKRGKTGFAHLFEHLMFNGTEHFNDEYFKPFEKVGATDMNGTTNNDRTNYFENVPKNALDLALWMESDRMGYMIGAIDQAKLDEQRGVVQNEKRQGENQPYGKVWTILAEHTFPSEHPYSWPVIGYMDDLNAASLDDVHEWFKNYYGAANATLVIAGDVNADEVKQKVEEYFGNIPSGPPVEKFDRWIPKMTGEHRFVMQDRVPQPRLYKVYNIPEYGSKEGTYFELISDVLASGKTSRLYKRLVYDEQLATNVNAFAYLREIAGQLIIVVSLRPGVEMAKVEKILNEELDKFLKEGPTADELDRVKTGYLSSFVKGIERIGGFGGKSDILASSFVYTGDPGHYKQELNWVVNATEADLLSTAKKWMSDGYFVLEVHPFPKYATTGKDVDRSKLPEVGEPPKPEFPAFASFKMKNGLEVYLVQRKSVPVVNASLIVDAGFAADQFAKPGVANFTLEMMNEGTKKYSSLELNDELEKIGADLRTGSSLDVSSVSLSALNTTLDKAFELFSEVALHPTFPDKEIERLRKQILNQIQNEMAQPIGMALRVLPKFLYGQNHAYGNPLTGSGTFESVKSITRDDLVKFHKTWFKANNAKLLVVGDISEKELKKLLNKYFQKWESGTVPQKNIAKVNFPKHSVVYIMDRPQSPQALIIAGHVAPPKNDPDELAIDAMNNILGGTFTSRINMNLREDKHWSYGARTLLLGARGQSPYIIYAPVQIDKTSESMLEIMKELKGVLSDKPITDQEVEKVRKNMVLKLPGTWETNRSILGDLAEIVTYNLPKDYYKTYPGRVMGLDKSQLEKAAKKVLHPDQLTWIVIGDKSKILDKIKAAGFKEIHLIDPSGNVLE
jgi:zinc protease